MIKLVIITIAAMVSFSAQAQFFNFGGGSPFGPQKDKSGCWKYNSIRSKYRTEAGAFDTVIKVPVEGDACKLAEETGISAIKQLCKGDCEVHRIAEPVDTEVSCAVLLMGGCGGGRHVAGDHHEPREREIHHRERERHEAPPAWTPPPKVEAVN